jgi:hypothetical protein
MGDQRITEEKGKNYFFQGIALGHLLDELVVGVPLVRLWSYSETKIPIWVAATPEVSRFNLLLFLSKGSENIKT